MSMAGKTTHGSYDPAAATGLLEDELERLELQVRLTGNQEIELLRQHGLTDGQAIADIGCGPGHFGKLLLRSLPSCFLQGIEISPALCRLAESRWMEFGSRASVSMGSVYDIESRFFETCDFVIGRYLLQHLDHPVKAARSIYEMLVPGGSAAIIDIDEGLWGCVVPQQNLFEHLYRKAGMLQASRGGDRLIGRRLPRILKQAGFAAPNLHVFAVHSDTVGMSAIDFHINPSRLLPAVTKGLLTLEEYGRAQIAYKEFLSDPDAFAIVLGFACLAKK